MPGRPQKNRALVSFMTFRGTSTQVLLVISIKNWLVNTKKLKIHCRHNYSLWASSGKLQYWKTIRWPKQDTVQGSDKHYFSKKTKKSVKQG